MSHKPSICKRIYLHSARNRVHGIGLLKVGNRYKLKYLNKSSLVFFIINIQRLAAIDAEFDAIQTQLSTKPASSTHYNIGISQPLSMANVESLNVFVLPLVKPLCVSKPLSINTGSPILDLTDQLISNEDSSKPFSLTDLHFNNCSHDLSLVNTSIITMPLPTLPTALSGEHAHMQSDVEHTIITPAFPSTFNKSTHKPTPISTSYEEPSSSGHLLIGLKPNVVVSSIFNTSTNNHVMSTHHIDPTISVISSIGLKSKVSGAKAAEVVAMSEASVEARVSSLRTEMTEEQHMFVEYCL